MNRSGLVGTLVLEAHSWTAKEAIDLLRSKRSSRVPTNTHFLAVLGVMLD